jgi:hypothetical protein
MKSHDYAIGQAVFIRSDTPDYEEETIPFKTLGDLVKLCSEPRENMVLDKIIAYAMPKGEAHAVTLGFISAAKGAKPKELEEILSEL